MLNVNWEKIHSLILSVTCHGLRNFPLLIHIPLYPFVNFWNLTSYYFLSLSFDPPHPPLHDTPHPTPSWPTHPTPPLVHFWAQRSLFSWAASLCLPYYYYFFFFELVTHKMLNVNWEKIHSLILSVTCHGLRNFPPLIHIPLYPFVNFWQPMSCFFFELESLIKCWIWIGKKFTQ